jgi:hypothetical protein
MKRIVPRSAPKAVRPSPSKPRAKNRSFVSVLTRGEIEPQVPGGKEKPSSLERRREREASPAVEVLSRDEPRDTIRMDEFLYNPVLLPGLTAPVSSAPMVPQASALERAQAAALAERVLHSVHVGRIQGGHLVRLRLSSDVEVQLRHCDGVLQATVVGEGDQGALARRLDTELRARGLRFDRVELG